MATRASAPSRSERGSSPERIASFGAHDAAARELIARVAAADEHEWVAVGNFAEDGPVAAKITAYEGPQDRAWGTIWVHAPDVADYLEHFDVEQAHFKWYPPRSEDAGLASRGSCRSHRSRLDQR